MELKNLIRKENIYFIGKSDKAGVLEELIAMGIKQGKVHDPVFFRQAIHERESLMSTGIGLGIAIPHAKLSCISEFFITIGLLAAPVEWDSLDRKPVSIVFLIGGPENSQAGYLQLLARIMLVIKNETKLQKLKAAKNTEEAAVLFG